MSERLFESVSPAETEALAERLGALLEAEDVVLLDGELGAGKTCFVRGLARGVGADPAGVSSPTYVIAQEYAGNGVTLVHVDAYRLNGDDDLDAIGVEGSGVVLAVEWASNLGDAAPAGGLRVRIEHAGDERRRITMSGGERWARRIENL